MNSSLAEIRQRVRTLRMRLGLSRRELSERSGLSQRFLADLESKGANISVARLADLAAALGTTPVDLLGGVDAPPRARHGPVVALLGVRGAGKSTIGRRLAGALGLPFVELDAWVEEAAGLALAEIFAVHGEAYYRRLEREMLQRFLATTQGAVLATGGSLVSDPETYALLRAGATTAWLRAGAEDHWRRVVEQGDRRPMAHNPNAMAELRALLAARAPLYAQADLVIETAKLGIEGSVAALARAVGRARRQSIGSTSTRPGRKRVAHRS